jgi:hypothetical protein
MMSSRDFLLKYPAAICCSFFGKRRSYFLLCSLILFHAHGASAFFSDGKINDDFSYRSLRVEMLKTKHGKCYLEGEILNNTNITQEDIAITFYAYDFFDHSLWKQIVHIDIVDPFYDSRKGRHFRKKMRHCDMPAKFQFKVTGVKEKEAKKTIAEKPKSKKSVLEKSRKNENSDPDDLHPGHGKRPSVSHPQAVTPRDGTLDASAPVVPIQRYLIILTNGKTITTDSCREQDNAVFFNKEGGEVQISKDKVSEIRKQN